MMMRIRTVYHGSTNHSSVASKGNASLCIHYGVHTMIITISKIEKQKRKTSETNLE